MIITWILYGQYIGSHDVEGRRLFHRYTQNVLSLRGNVIYVIIMSSTSQMSVTVFQITATQLFVQNLDQAENKDIFQAQHYWLTPKLFSTGPF